MTRLYLIRHGEAEGNLYRRMQGHYDSDLTELGRKQAEALTRRFRDIPLDAVFSSDLYRAMATAAGICLQKGLPLRTDPRLREVDVGPWENLPFGNAALRDPEEMERFRHAPEQFSLPGADTFRGLAHRGFAALCDIVSAYPEGAVAVCLHGWLLKALLCRLFYGFERSGSIAVGQNTAVTLLTCQEGQFHLVYESDDSHLAAEQLLRNRWTPETGPADLSFSPLTDVERYIKYRSDAWKLIYGNMRDFSGPGFWLDAQQTVGRDPQAMVEAFLGRTPVGMIQLSPDRDARKGVGYIPFICLREPFRHKGLGIQLIGHAACFYKNLGRTWLQLSVAHTNENALAFYRKFGFRAVGKTPGRYGKLILMEKDLSRPPLPKGLSVISTQPAGAV